MPTIADPTPAWQRDPSVFDSPMIRGLRMVGSLLGADNPATSIMGSMGGPMMAKAPQGFDPELYDQLVFKLGGKHPNPAVNQKLSSLEGKASPDLINEIRHYGSQYGLAKMNGDSVQANELGKRIAELDRIARTGVGYTPSGDALVSPSEIGLSPSKTILSSRALTQLKNTK